MRVEALVGDERAALASDYLARQLRAPFWGAPHDGVRVRLEMPLGEGDVRPLVRHLRAIAVYAAGLLEGLLMGFQLAPLDALFAESTPERERPRYFALKGAAGNVGLAAGPAVAGV